MALPPQRYGTALNDPAFTPLVHALRSILPFTYIYTEEPDRFMGVLNEEIRGVGTFATTDPKGEYRSRARNWTSSRAPAERPEWFVPRNPASIVHLISKVDPKDEIALGVVKVESPETLLVDAIQEDIRVIQEKHLTNKHWVTQLLFIGAVPPSKAIPENLWDSFNPIQVPAVDSSAIDTRQRQNPASEEDLLKLYADAWRWLAMKPRDPVPPLSDEQKRLLAGLTIHEIHNITHLSVLRWVEEGRTPGSFPEQVFNPATIVAYRHRWARVP
jgi:hypothetical protein